MDYRAILANARQKDVLLALAVIGLIVMFFVPLPAPVLDVLIAANITLGLLILLTVMFVKRALEFTSFPMLLLVTTTFRLALNVASTRLILEQGHSTTAAAGHIIEAFGNVIMGGNFVIGLVIFTVLILVNFIVITKGSGRIAEVAARFTLDSLPGKQMAIDADLNAGLINEDQARTRRSELEQETGFFGAMDGASKFVRGDAIAGLIITGINIVFGIIVGTMQHDMAIGEAANRYFVMTVGDGLVAYIPALTISIASGMLVAKSGTTSGAGTVVLDQMANSPRALLVSSGLLVFISLLPGMPVFPFWLMAGAVGAAGWYALKGQRKVEGDRKAEQVAEKAAEQAAAAPPVEQPLASLLHVDTLRLELGYGLLSLIDESKGGRLTEQIKATRRQLARDLGFVIPSVRIQDNLQLKPGDYNIFIKETKAGGGTLEPGMLLAMDPTGGAAPAIEGRDTIEPTFGLPARWINDNQRENAQFNGYTVVDNANVVVTHLTEIVKDSLADLLTRSELDKLLDELRGTHGKLIDELVPDKVSKPVLQKVLQNLLRERVSIRDLPGILEALAEVVPGMRNLTLLTEHVRSRISRQLTAQHVGGDGVVSVVALSPAWEREFMDSIMSTDKEGMERQLAMAPDKIQNFLRTTSDTFTRQFNSGLSPILLTSPVARPFARLLIERSLPTVAVLSQAEISPKAKLRTVATV
ncbi:MAG: flagellar biosynthesis protein FlhA [Alphaproteobacteria bacterium]|nr:MAG: flagellar biosynthesis protein FlhA [Alphaproteobacteria bacterium]